MKTKNYIYCISAKSEHELTKEMNNFGELHDVFATQIKEPNTELNHWVAFVYYRAGRIDPVQKEIPRTIPQKVEAKKPVKPVIPKVPPMKMIKTPSPEKPVSPIVPGDICKHCAFAIKGESLVPYCDHEDYPKNCKICEMEVKKK